MVEQRSSRELVCAKCGKDFPLEMIEKRNGNVRPRLSLYCTRCVAMMGGAVADDSLPNH